MVSFRRIVPLKENDLILAFLVLALTEMLQTPTFSRYVKLSWML